MFPSSAGELAGEAGPNRALRIAHRTDGRAESIIHLVKQSDEVPIEQLAWLKAAKSSPGERLGRLVAKKPHQMSHLLSWGLPLVEDPEELHVDQPVPIANRSNRMVFSRCQRFVHVWRAKACTGYTLF